MTRNKNPARSHWKLARKFYTTPFTWTVLNDDNRYEDGRALRWEFVEEVGERPVDRDWLALDCSILEMLIALSRKVSFESFGSPGDWFWKLVENLELKYADDIYEVSIDEEVEEVLDNLVNRTYERNGRGGLFPLRDHLDDQRDVEIWYQAAAYLEEGERRYNGPEGLRR